MGSLNVILVEGIIVRITPYPSGAGAYIQVAVRGEYYNKETKEHERITIYPKDFTVPYWDWRDPHKKKMYKVGARVIVKAEYAAYPMDIDGRRTVKSNQRAIRVSFLDPQDTDVDVELMSTRKGDFYKEVAGNEKDGDD